MISTVTTATVTTVTSVITTVTGLTGVIALIAVIAFLALLIQKEMVSTAVAGRLNVLARSLNIALVPLGIASAMITVVQILHLIS